MNDSNFINAIPINKLPPTVPIRGFIVMPERIDSNSVGYYNEQSTSVYKDLAAMGADVSYYTQQHKLIQRYSAGEKDVIEFFIGFFLHGLLYPTTYDILKTYILSRFSKKPKGTAKGKIYIASDANGLSTWQEYNVNGSVDDAIKMIDKIQELHKNNVNSRKKIT